MFSEPEPGPMSVAQYVSVREHILAFDIAMAFIKHGIPNGDALTWAFEGLAEGHAILERIMPEALKVRTASLLISSPVEQRQQSATSVTDIRRALEVQVRQSAGIDESVTLPGDLASLIQDLAEKIHSVGMNRQ